MAISKCGKWKHRWRGKCDTYRQEELWTRVSDFTGTELKIGLIGTLGSVVWDSYTFYTDPDPGKKTYFSKTLKIFGEKLFF